jgi:two-component system, NtrC family, response regulator AtoC
MGHGTHLGLTVGAGGEDTRRDARDGRRSPRRRWPEPAISAGVDLVERELGESVPDFVRRLEAGPANPGLIVTATDPIVDRIARSRVSVLILGETGAGKEVLAQRIHASSPRAGKPMISFNCAAVCETLIDSQLFGYQRGTFTGAEHNQTGLIEAADGGTLFLDEVGELSPAAQAKLLRVLETRVVTRLGGVSSRPIDVRFIAATNRDLDRASAEGSFRADLRYRLDGVRVSLLPLRARPAEILPAARHFLDELARRDGLALAELSPEAEVALLGYGWPGNFRELRNVVERAALISQDGRIEAAHLLLPVLHQTLDVAAAEGRAQGGESARQRIVAALFACAGNQTRAAAMLGISRRTLITRLQTLDIPRPRVRPPRSFPTARTGALRAVEGGAS